MDGLIVVESVPYDLDAVGPDADLVHIGPVAPELPCQFHDLVGALYAVLGGDESDAGRLCEQVEDLVGGDLLAELHDDRLDVHQGGGRLDGHRGDVYPREDGIHIDDYFYPYPVKGLPIPDDADFRANNNGIKDRGDWRRDNVNLFVKQLYETIHKVKPWVKLGVSPFGIYRNAKSAPGIGSKTNGL